MENIGFFDLKGGREHGFLGEWFRTCFRFPAGMVKKPFRAGGECERSLLRKIGAQAP
jgi:hypothetical protein